MWVILVRQPNMEGPESISKKAWEGVYNIVNLSETRMV